MKKLLIILICIFVSGCSDIYELPPEPLPAYYWTNPQKEMYNVGRVVFVELYNSTEYEDITLDITNNLANAIQKRQLLGLTVVKRADDRWKSLQIMSMKTLTLDELSRIRDKFRCDAVILGVVTEYGAYPHLSVGLDMKMVDLKDGDNIWMLEQVWQADDRHTEYAIKRYLEKMSRNDSVSFKHKVVSMSTYEFIKFIAYEVSRTFR